MGVHMTFVQPQFADQLVDEVTALLQVEGLAGGKELLVYRPDYTQQVGTSSNPHRTALWLAAKETKDGKEITNHGNYTVRISNLLGKEEGQEEADVIAIVFESFPGTPKATGVTRHYISQERLDSKMIKVTMRNKAEAAHDIWKFLVHGTPPAML
jgi:hypothetical protein